MTEKKYLYIILLSIFLFVVFHFLTWNLLTKELYESKNNINVGDLGRMSYLTHSLAPRSDEQNLSHKHISYKSDEKIDVITIGDSFSHGGAHGSNKYYQDFIASNQNLKVMNISVHNEGFIETVLILDNLGILDTLKPKSIILQSVERHAINRYSKKIDWNIGLKNNSSTFLFETPKPKQKPKLSFINRLNYNLFLYPILYKFFDNAMFSKVYIADMNEHLFSCDDSNKLLYYFQDLRSLNLATSQSIAQLNDNLNKLHEVLKKKKIKLYFMPAVDKYNLYSKYIIKNKYKESVLFELLRELPKKYTFIDTKKILRNLTDRGIKDIYYSDDSHWSYKASEEIFNKINFK